MSSEPPIADDVAGSKPPRRPSWHSGAVPLLSAPFLSLTFLDPFGALILPRSGLLRGLVELLASATLATLLFYLPAARMGARSGRGLPALADAGFGARVGPWALGPLLIGAGVAFLALFVRDGVDLTFRGLHFIGMYNAAGAFRVEVAGHDLGPLAWLATALAWSLALASVAAAPTLIRIVGALGKLAAPWFAISWMGLMAWGIWSARGEGVAMPPSPEGAASAPAYVLMTYILAFAAAALFGSAAEWGAALAEPKDVDRAGWVGVWGAIAAGGMTVLATLTILGPSSRDDLSVREAALDRVGGWLGAVLAWGFALGLMALAVFAAAQAMAPIARAFPKERRLPWTLGLGASAFALIIGGVADRALPLVCWLAAFLAPMIGALWGWSLRGGRADSPRRAWDPATLLAWGIGAGIALISPTAPLGDNSSWLRSIPTLLVAFLAALIVRAAFPSAGPIAPPPTAPEGTPPEEAGSTGAPEPLQ